ncbi:MAG: hypothetical protein WC426_04035 [Sulfuriferula sp.]
MRLRNYFKRYERVAFIVLLLLTMGTGTFGIYCVLGSWSNGAKWVATSGSLATVAGMVQLEVSGLFKNILEHYGDEDKYPYGPPSYVSQEIIDNPEEPFLTGLRNICYFNVGTGFWLIVLGTIVQIIAVWL